LCEYHEHINNRISPFIKDLKSNIGKTNILVLNKHYWSLEIENSWFDLCKHSTILKKTIDKIIPLRL